MTDHVTVLDDAVAQLPINVAVGHHENDKSDLVKRDVIVRADSPGCTEGSLAACRARNGGGFFVSARKNPQVEAAIFDAIGIEEVWLPSLDQDGELKDDSSVVGAHLIDR